MTSLDGAAAVDRYSEGSYDVEFGDDEWKAEQMARLIATLSPSEITTFADVGCGSGGVTIAIHRRLTERGFRLRQTVGYDVLPESKFRRDAEGVVLRRSDFLNETETFDLVTLNDVVEHVTAPQRFLEQIGSRARFVALHIPLDDRLSVTMTGQYNYRLGPVGHLSFWNQSTALNLLTASGLTPLSCFLTPGFMAPSSRVRAIQRLALPVRWLLWRINPGLMARTVGGASLAVLCRTPLGQSHA